MIGGVGGLFTVFLAVKGQDRALSLVPTWLLFLVWIFATGMTLSGRMSGDVVVASLVAGLVLVVILMGFTVTQFAFRSADTSYAGAPTEMQARPWLLQHPDRPSGNGTSAATRSRSDLKSRSPCR